MDGWMDANEQLRVKCECQGEQKACKCELGKAGSFIYDVMIQHEANMANLKFSRILLGVNCILRWASYKEKTTCPQCKHPFKSLIVHRALDGSMKVYMQEESVCLLLRATWFEPLVMKLQEETYDEMDDFYAYGYVEDDDELDEAYYHNSTIRLGNRRWGDNGYVRGGRQEARPVYHPNLQASGSGSSRQPKQKQPVQPVAGRRAKRALKREAADKAAAAKHQMHLERMGRK